MRALGADVVRTPDEAGMQGAIIGPKRSLPEIPGPFMAGQFENPANPDFHHETTADEIFDQMDGAIDASCDRRRHWRDIYWRSPFHEGKDPGLKPAPG